MTTEQLLLRIPEAARLCGVSKSKLYHMIHEGSVPIVRFGKSIRIPTDTLRKVISDRTRMDGTTAKPKDRAAL
jgi:excisionase family DNA binding protein